MSIYTKNVAAVCYTAVTNVLPQKTTPFLHLQKQLFTNNLRTTLFKTFKVLLPIALAASILLIAYRILLARKARATIPTQPNARAVVRPEPQPAVAPTVPTSPEPIVEPLGPAAEVPASDLQFTESQHLERLRAMGTAFSLDAFAGWVDSFAGITAPVADTGEPRTTELPGDVYAGTRNAFSASVLKFLRLRTVPNPIDLAGYEPTKLEFIDSTSTGLTILVFPSQYTTMLSVFTRYRVDVPGQSPPVGQPEAVPPSESVTALVVNDLLGAVGDLATVFRAIANGDRYMDSPAHTDGSAPLQAVVLVYQHGIINGKQVPFASYSFSLVNGTPSIPAADQPPPACVDMVLQHAGPGAKLDIRTYLHRLALEIISFNGDQEELEALYDRFLFYLVLSESAVSEDDNLVVEGIWHSLRALKDMPPRTAPDGKLLCAWVRETLHLQVFLKRARAHRGLAVEDGSSGKIDIPLALIDKLFNPDIPILGIFLALKLAAGLPCTQQRNPEHLLFERDVWEATRCLTKDQRVRLHTLVVNAFESITKDEIDESSKVETAKACIQTSPELNVSGL